MAKKENIGKERLISGAADMIVFNGKVFSVSEDDTVIGGSAVVICDSVIKTVCETDEEAMRYAGDETELIDCQGNTILPGLCDDHAHPSWAASFYIGCSLFEAMSSPEDTSDDAIEKYRERLRPYIAANPDYKLYRGIGWNRAYFSGTCKDPRWPTRHDLDQVCRDKPVILESYCQHALWANTKAIEMAGITADTPDPETGEIQREEDGYPSGIFMEFEPMALLKEGIASYDFTVEQYKQALLRYQREDANYFGVTLVDDCYCTENAIKAYKELAEEGRLTVRFRGVYKLEEAASADVERIKRRAGQDDVGDLYRINTIKIFIEGEMAMLEPYEEDAVREMGYPSGYCGETFWPDDVIYPVIRECADTGMQIHIHAMGDKAVRQAVRGLAAAQQATGKCSRNVVAHLMAVSDEDIAIMAENGIMCSCQPRWMVYETDAEDFYSTLFGRKRALEFWPNKRLSDAGCVVAYGTDFPVSPPPNPYQEMQCAMTRSVFEEDVYQYPKYKGKVYGPEDDLRRDCVSLESAVKSLTYNGAWQNFLEDVTGTIEEGKSAELVILDRDITAIPVEQIHKIKVRKTIFKGKVVYDQADS